MKRTRAFKTWTLFKFWMQHGKKRVVTHTCKMILRSLHGRMLDDGCKEGRNVKLPLEDYVFFQRSNFIILNQAVTTMKMSWQKQAAQHSEFGFYSQYGLDFIMNTRMKHLYLMVSPEVHSWREQMKQTSAGVKWNFRQWWTTDWWAMMLLHHLKKFCDLLEMWHVWIMCM